MFTGLVSHLGTVSAIDTNTELTIRIHEKEIPSTIGIGNSISCNGICLTVVDTNTKGDPWFAVQASKETQDKTNIIHWKVGTPVNLERPLRVGDELGGHIVLGHVDGVVKIKEIKPVGDSQCFTFENNSQLHPFLPPKGSVSINGVSLTINDVSQEQFNVNLIPHTQKVTGFHFSQVGDLVNIEIDPIARYVKQILHWNKM